MPVMSSISGLSARAFGLVWGAITSVFDNWVSGTPRSLGTSTSGTLWSVVQGSWTASGNGLATTSTAATSYPFAVVPLNQNVQASIQNATPGSGLVFWETDAGDWWASIVNATSASVATGTQCVSSTCCTGSPSTCVSNVCCGGTVGITGCIGGSYNACCTMTANTCVSNSCCTTATIFTTYYYWGLAIIKSVASAISTVASVTINTALSPGALIQSLSLTVIGGNIAAQAYSDTTLTTPDGPPLTTTGTPGGTNVGIIVAPTTQGAATAASAYNQGNSVGQYSAH